MAAASFLSQVFHPVATFYPDPKLRVPTLQNRVDQVAQRAFLNNYQAQAAKDIARRVMQGVCVVLNVSSVVAAFATLSVGYFGYVCVATCVVAAVLERFWKGAPEDLVKQARKSMEEGNEQKAIKLINMGACDQLGALMLDSMAKGCPAVLRHLLSLGFGSTVDAWNAKSVEMADIFVDYGMPLNYPEVSMLVCELRDWGMLHDYGKQSPISSFIDQLKVLDLYYRRGAAVSLNKFRKDHVSIIKGFIKKALAEQSSDPTWPQVCKSLKEIQQTLFPDTPSQTN